MDSRFVFLMLLSLFLLSSCATESGEEQSFEKKDIGEEKDFEEGSKGVFYKVDSGENDLYLFGTIHFGREDMYPMHGKVKHYFKNSDVLGLEIDMSEISEMELGLEMADKGTFTDPQKELKDIVSLETFNQALEYLKPLGIDEDSLNQFKPWFVAQMISERAITSAGYSPELGVESKLLEMAIKEEMDVIGIEKIEDQMAPFGKLDEDGGEEFLKEAIEEKEKAEQHIGVLATYWKENNKERMRFERASIRSIEEPVSFKKFYDALFDQRDENMAEEISNILEDEERNYFIAVGYLHLVGEESIVENLEDKGYSVKCMYE